MTARVKKPIRVEISDEWAVTVIAGVTPDMWQWCRDNLESPCDHLAFTAFFNNQQDADLFYLTFA